VILVGIIPKILPTYSDQRKCTIGSLMIRLKPVLSHASIVCDVLASVNSVNSDFRSGHAIEELDKIYIISKDGHVMAYYGKILRMYVSARRKS